MSTTMEDDLNELQDASKKLSGLLEHREEGLTTYIFAVKKQVERIANVYHSSGMDQEKTHHRIENDH